MRLLCFVALLVSISTVALAQYAPFIVSADGGGPNFLLGMDFDNGSCADSQGGGWTATEASSGNCDGTAIDGSTWSGDVNAANGATISLIDAGIEQTSGFVTANVLIQTTANGSGLINPIFSLRDSADNPGCRIRHSPTALYFRPISGDGTDGSNITIVDGTLYYLTIRYDIDTDACTLMVSATGFGASEVGSNTATGVTGVNVAGFTVHQRSSENVADISIDSFRLCDGDYGTTSGLCVNQ